MTEILDLAKLIANTKEQIRKAITNHEIECGQDIPFSQYPIKITQIKRDKPILAINYLGHVPIQGEKIFIQKIEQAGGKILELYSDTQLEQYSKAYLLQDVNATFLINTGAYEIKVKSWSSDSGFNLIYSQSIGYENQQALSSQYPLIIYSTNLVKRISSTSSGASGENPEKFISSRGIVSGETGYFYMPDGIAYKKDTKEVYKYNPLTAKIESKLGVCEYDIDTYTSTCGSRDGKYIICSYSHSVHVNTDGVYKKYIPKTLNNITSASGVFSFIGITSDNKYLIALNYNEAGDDTTRVHIITTDNGFETDTYKDVPGLVLPGVPTWYPDKQILCVNKAGTIKIYKYENGGFTEIPMDFGDLTFTNEQQVTINKDFTKILINDCEGSSGRSYLFDIKITDKGYKAIPANLYNYSDKTIIGYCTGNNSGGKVEAQTLLPSSIDINPVWQPLPPIELMGEKNV